MTDDREHEQTYERMRAGDADALEDLLRMYLPRLRAFVRARMSANLRARESSSDLVQSVCRRLVAGWDGLQFDGETQFRGWLFTAAANEIREKHRYHRALKRDAEREVRLEAGSTSPDPMLSIAYGEAFTPSRAAATDEFVRKLEASIDGLSDEHREVIMLTRIAGLPHEEVATRMGRTVGAVRQLLSRALLKLSFALES